MTEPKRPGEGETPAPPPEGEAVATSPATSPEDGAGPDSTRDAKDVDALASLLRRSLAASAGAGAGGAVKEPDLLRGVQRRIRQRSKGKFFGDGWSTGDARNSYAVIALAMLVVTGIAYFALAWVTVR